MKDGSKIIGTIVGYEGDSFKVQTSYGFATVRKDSIAEIIPTEAKKPAAPVTPPSSPKVNGDLVPAKASAPPKEAHPLTTPKTGPSSASAMPVPAPSSKAAVKNAAASPAPASAPLGPATATATAVEPPVPSQSKPQPIQETIRGNFYLNQTYGFQLYRPPGWDLIADAGRALPNAITALGTSDETTLLVVGHDPVTESLDAHAVATERKLHDIYDNYRPLSTQHTTIAGLPAVETHFRGGLGEHDWSVVVVTLARGKELFTLLAMTYADSDLIQIQENVISKIIGSLEFTTAN